MGIYSVLYLFGVYSILLLVSFFLKKSKIRNRNILEYGLILIYVISHTLYYLNWDVGSELYFNENKVPFVGNNQNFIIVFGIDGKEELPNNTFTDNEIYIPENGILLTSSSTDSYKHSYRFEKDGSGSRFVTDYFEECNCYGIANHQFNYVVGAINDSGTIDYNYENAILETICDKLNTGGIKSNLTSGYKDGTYLEQTEIVINNKNLTSLPKGLLELQNLEYINIHSNDLKTIPLEVYQFLKLKKLYIGFNNIVELPDKIGTLTTLESLAVNGNELTDLPDTLLTLPKLNYLSVRENKFSEETQLELYDKYKQKGIELQFK
jgi:Leucine-rich repeat (LRR) protein